MAEETPIEWTDATFNPWIGCTKVSPACDHCYAAISTPARTLSVEWGADKPRYRTSAANWKQPLKWNSRQFAECMSCGWRGKPKKCHSVQSPESFYPPVVSARVCPRCMEPTIKESRCRVFCASLADWLDNEVPAEWLADLLHLIRLTPNLDWLMLSKRVGNLQKRLKETRDFMYSIEGALNESEVETLVFIEAWIDGSPPANVWIGATICNQEEADRDVPKLLRIPAAVRFLSIEPMLGPIDLTAITQSAAPGYFGDCLEWYHQPRCERDTPYPTISQVIVGGESGPHARPMHPDWPRALRDQCAAASVAFLMKQWGEWANQQAAGLDLNRCYDESKIGGWVEMDGRSTSGDNAAPEAPTAAHVFRIGKKAAGRLLDGVTHDGFPRSPA